MRAGQLGHDNLLDQSQPTLISSLPERVNISSVACGGNSSALIDSEGHLYTFGCGDLGVLGLGSTRDTPTPTSVPEFGPSNPLRSISLGDCHMLAVSSTLAEPSSRTADLEPVCVQRRDSIAGAGTHVASSALGTFLTSGVLNLSKRFMALRFRASALVLLILVFSSVCVNHFTCCECSC
jgi:hypothetical protein